MNKMFMIASIVLSFSFAHAGNYDERPTAPDSLQDSPQDQSNDFVAAAFANTDEDPDGSGVTEDENRENIKRAAAHLRTEGQKYDDAGKKSVFGLMFYFAAQILDNAYGVPGTNFIVTQFHALAIAEIFTGLVHWAEDTYGEYIDEETPGLGSIVKHNKLHHQNGRAFLKKTFWQRNGDQIVAGAIAITLFYFVLDQHFVLAASSTVWAALTNEFHASTHRSESEKSWLEHVLQSTISQNTPQHLDHHRNTTRSYFVLTGWGFNWVADYFQFWRKLERVVEIVTGLKPRPNDPESSSDDKVN